MSLGEIEKRKHSLDALIRLTLKEQAKAPPIEPAPANVAVAVVPNLTPAPPTVRYAPEELMLSDEEFDAEMQMRAQLLQSGVLLPVVDEAEDAENQPGEIGVRLFESIKLSDNVNIYVVLFVLVLPFLCVGAGFIAYRDWHSDVLITTKIFSILVFIVSLPLSVVMLFAILDPSDKVATVHFGDRLTLEYQSGKRRSIEYSQISDFSMRGCIAGNRTHSFFVASDTPEIGERISRAIEALAKAGRIDPGIFSGRLERQAERSDQNLFWSVGIIGGIVVFAVTMLGFARFMKILADLEGYVFFLIVVPFSMIWVPGFLRRVRRHMRRKKQDLSS